MKKLITLLIVLPIIIFAACAPQETQSPPSVSVPSGLTYNSTEEFINGVNNAKEAYEKTGDNTYEKIEEIDWYYDFKDPVKDVVLYAVFAQYNHVNLYYRNKEAEASYSSALILQFLRPSDFDLNDPANEEKHLENIREVYSNGYFIDIMINGHKALKHDNDYYWVENGTAIFLRIPAWLLERYPEETFFDIQKVMLEERD